MLGICTRDKEKIIKCLLCVTTYVLLTSMIVQAEEWPQCLPLKKDIPHKRHLQAGHNLDITLEMSSRITHQLSTHIYRILLQEQLGYARVKIVVRDDYNVETISERLNCYKRDNDSVYEQIISVTPESMINLEVPVPTDYNVPALENSCVQELGTLSPPGHFGWFIPLELTKESQNTWFDESNSLQWASFKNSKFVKSFEVTDIVKSLIDNNTVYISNGFKNYYCNDPLCMNGWFIPEQCKNKACALLLAPDYNNTKEIIDHIKKMNVLIKVAWVGDNLQHVVKTLIKLYTQTKTSKNFIILSWTPSNVIFNTKDFITVNMPRCDHPNYRNTTDGCFYEIRRSVKFAWDGIKTDSHIFELLKQMNFLDMKHYNSLLEMYESGGNKSMSELACDWLKKYNNYWEEWLPEKKNAIYIGGIFPITGSTYTGRGIIRGATMATEAINKNKTILENFDLRLLVADGQCRADKVMKAFIDYITRDLYGNLIGVLGPACSETVEPLAGLSKYYKTITISYSAEGAFFSDRDKYPYFFRTIGENKHYKFVYLEMLKKLGWSRVAALTEDGQKYTEYISHMQELLAENSINFIANTKFPRQRGEMRRYLEDLKLKHARIIIADVFDEIARNVMCEAFKLEMTSKQGYVWFLPTWLNNTWYDTNYFNQQFNESVNCSTSKMIEAINGYFSMTHAYFGEDDAIIQENITVAKWKENYYHKSNSISSNFAGYAYDAVWTYALALDTLMKKDPEAVYELHSTNVTNKLTQIIKDIDFEGVSGRIKFRGGVTRFSVINIMQWYKNESRIIGRFHPNISTEAPEIIGGRLDLNISAIVWLNKDRKKPDDGTLPPVECTLNSLAKFLNVRCEMAIIILNMFIILILLISLGSVVVVIKKRYDRKFMTTKKYMNSLGLEHLLTEDYSGLDQWEIERECVVLNRKLGEGAFGTVYGGEAKIKIDNIWKPVAVKTLKIGSTTEEKLDFLSEAEIMKRFDHKNIVKLIGVCTKVEPVYTIMELMLYGDLKTYLLARRHLANGTSVEAEEVSSKKLTSMAIDVARGLGYLAELRYVHRDIACRNCLLGSQRVVKIGDFGMTRPVLDNDYYKFNRRGMLPVRWMAPESLALGVFTPSSDIWSFGVLLFEIMTFGSFPFQGLSNTQVLEYVKNGNSVTIPQGVKPPLDCLLKNCWNLDPQKRPSASELVDYLANNSRLVHPCIDIPISSVQLEDTGQLEMQLPEQFRKCSSSLSFKNLPLSNGISSASIHSPLKKQHSLQEGADFSNQIDSCSPKDPLLQASSISECSKSIPLQSLTDCHEDDEYTFNQVFGSAMSKV